MDEEKGESLEARTGRIADAWREAPRKIRGLVFDVLLAASVDVKRRIESYDVDAFHGTEHVDESLHLTRETLAEVDRAILGALVVLGRAAKPGEREPLHASLERNALRSERDGARKSLAEARDALEARDREIKSLRERLEAAEASRESLTTRLDLCERERARAESLWRKDREKSLERKREIELLRSDLEAVVSRFNALIGGES